MFRNDNFDTEIAKLVQLACSHAPKSIQRQQCLTRLICLMKASGKIWKESTPYYEDALQQSWIYFCQNLCEATTARQAYNPEIATVFTWFNIYIKHRLKDFYITEQNANNNSGSPDQIDNIPAEDDIEAAEAYNLAEMTKHWVEKDPIGELRNTHIRGRKDVNAQAIILRRFFPPTKSWQEISDEFDMPISTLSSFFQNKCLPILRNFGQKYR